MGPHLVTVERKCGGLVQCEGRSSLPKLESGDRRLERSRRRAGVNEQWPMTLVRDLE